MYGGFPMMIDIDSRISRGLCIVPTDGYAALGQNSPEFRPTDLQICYKPNP